MQSNPLGNTGLQVSRLALGGAQFGQQYGPMSLKQGRDVIEAAAEAGVNFLDTSAFYGLGASETMLGEILAGGLRESFTLCTKAGRLDRTNFDFTPAGMRECLEGSLKRLHVESVDVLLAHDIEFANDLDRVFTETAETLHRLKAEGKCRFVGMSAYPLPVLRKAIECCNLDVVVSYCHFNLQNRRLIDELLPVANAHGVGVLNASPLAMGLLTDAGPPPWNPADAEMRECARRAAAMCREHGTTLGELGMRFCFAEPAIPSTISGAATVEELRMNLRAMDEAPDAELLAEVDAIFAPVRDRVWKSGGR